MLKSFRNFLTLSPLLVAAAMLFASFDANAISLRYKFKVSSSGPRMYACNAGIIAQPADKKVCYNQNTGETCTDTSCKTSDKLCHSSCQCSSVNGAAWLMNYGKLKWVGQSPETGSGKATFRGTSTSTFSQAFSDEVAWGRRIQDLSFHLGSELYAAKYFVDICYNAPQQEYFEDEIQSRYVLTSAQAYAIDALYDRVVPGENSRAGMRMGEGKYTELAGIQVESFVTCDRQGVGQYVYARNNQGNYNTLDNEAGFVFGQNQMPIGAIESPESFYSTVAPVSLVGSAVDLLTDKTITEDTRAPRHCKVRYVFTETNWNSSKPIPRAWELSGAEMCTFTEIAEPIEKVSMGRRQY